MKIDNSISQSHWSFFVIFSKRNSVDFKYYDDEYIKFFAPKTTGDPYTRFLYYIRIVAKRKIFDKFFQYFKDQKVQFVNLGCGLDTTSLWVLDNFKNAVCFDLDLEFQVKLKIDILTKTKELLSLFPEHEVVDSCFHSDRYHIFGSDLREDDCLERLKQFGFRDSLPTIFLSEFVLTYLEDKFSSNVIRRLSSMSVRPTILVYYEYTKPNGNFIKWSNETFVASNTPLYSTHDHPNRESQLQRYKRLGWDDTFFKEFTYFYNNIIDKDERKRLRNIENFNDMLNLALICNHTAIGISVKNCNNMDEFFHYFNLNEVKENPDDYLQEFTDEELEEFDLSQIINIFHNIIDTITAESAQTQAFYDQFK